FTKYGGSLGETNSVSFMFERCGNIFYPAATASAESIFEAAVEAGADNAESDVNGHDITTSIENFAAARDALEEKLGAAESAGLIWKPDNTVPVSGDQAASLLKLIDALDDNDDVQNVFANYDIADDEL